MPLPKPGRLTDDLVAMVADAVERMKGEDQVTWDALVAPAAGGQGLQCLVVTIIPSTASPIDVHMTHTMFPCIGVGQETVDGYVRFVLDEARRHRRDAFAAAMAP